MLLSAGLPAASVLPGASLCIYEYSRSFPVSGNSQMRVGDLMMVLPVNVRIIAELFIWICHCLALVVCECC